MPITATISAATTGPPSGPPYVGSIVNAVSATVSSVAPGELITIYGTALSGSGTNTQVLFDGIAAPVIYSSPTQINAVVPYEVAGKTVTRLQIGYAPVSVPVAGAEPGILALTGTSVGPAAVLNQDNTINSPLNPAARGSVIQIFGTGEGLTSPASITGSITSGLHQSVLPVHVTVGGADATVQFAGGAPGEIAGVLQVNAIVPVSIAPGPNTEILLNIGGLTSHIGVTIAVR